jgi:hypothetical protein
MRKINPGDVHPGAYHAANDFRVFRGRTQGGDNFGMFAVQPARHGKSSPAA